MQELASGVDVINNLGLDTLTFLGATVLIVPAFKSIKQSPVSELQPHALKLLVLEGEVILNVAVFPSFADFGVLTRGRCVESTGIDPKRNRCQGFG